MPWSSWAGLTSTTILVGTSPATVMNQGISVSGTNFVETYESLFDSPFLAGSLEVVDGQLVAAGAAPDFSVLPKWRKVVRTIG